MRLFISIILGFLVTYQVSAQYEWAPIGAEWYYSRPEGLMPPNEGYILYKVFKDTIIQERVVRQIKKTYFHANGKQITDLGYEFTYLEDNVVYYFKDGDFYTLYDFNAQPGDKWAVYGHDNIGDFCKYDPIGKVVVDSVSTITINNYELKVLYTSPDSSSKWGFQGAIIEKVGSLGHFLPMAVECAVDIPYENGMLRCYQDSLFGKYKTYLWEKSEYDCDLLKLFSYSNECSNIDIRVFPNPAKDYLNIRYGGSHSDAKINQFEIFDIHGKKYNTHISSEKFFIANLPRGFYILRITASNEFFSLPFLKE